MAFFANRKNIKPMFRFITKIMMILLCRIETKVTLKRFDIGQFTCRYGIVGCIASFAAVGVSFVIIFACEFAEIFASFCFHIFEITLFMHSVAFFGLPVSFIAVILAKFAIILIAIFFCAILMKFRNYLNNLAMTTSFCFNSLRHGFFLIKKLCLEPLQTQYLCGSFYCNSFSLNINKKFEI